MKLYTCVTVLLFLLILGIPAALKEFFGFDPRLTVRVVLMVVCLVGGGLLVWVWEKYDL